MNVGWLDDRERRGLDDVVFVLGCGKRELFGDVLLEMVLGRWRRIVRRLWKIARRVYERGRARRIIVAEARAYELEELVASNRQVDVHLATRGLGGGLWAGLE